MCAPGRPSSPVDTTQRVMAGRRHITRRTNHTLLPRQEMESLSPDQHTRVSHLRPGQGFPAHYLPHVILPRPPSLLPPSLPPVFLPSGDREDSEFIDSVSG